MWSKYRKSWMGFVLFGLFISGCQANDTHTAGANNPSMPANQSSKQAKAKPPRASASSPRLVIQKWTSLPDKIIGNALAVDPQGTAFSIGGYNGQHSINKVYRLDNQVSAYAKLPVLMHDEAAGWIGHTLYIIGGGQSSSYDTIYKMSSDGKVSLDGHFPMPISDVNAVPYTDQGNPVLMVLGGYDGTHYNKKARVLQQQTPARLSETFNLPVGLRYAAVTSNGHDIFIAGGKTSGSLSDKIYAWSDSQRKVRLLATLPGAREKAAAFVFQNRLWVIGGVDGKGKVLDEVVEVNIDTGETKLSQPFPTPIADMGYAQDQNIGYLAGGQISTRDYSAAVYKLTFRA
jgi:hypothetical protein